MAQYETEAIVLRAIRYGEADSVLSLYTLARGRTAAIAKGARRTTSKLGGRLQPGTRVRVSVHEGRGDLGTLRGATMVAPNAGLWVEGHRLRAASCVLESAMRVLPQDEANPEAYHLLARALELLATAPAGPAVPRLDPLVLGCQCKLLVVSGLLPRLGACAGCGAGPPLTRFSAAAGGAVCGRCGTAGEPLAEETREALAGLLGRPLAEAPAACPPAAALGVERVIGLVLREHLGVTLCSATAL